MPGVDSLVQEACRRYWLGSDSALSPSGILRLPVELLPYNP